MKNKNNIANYIFLGIVSAVLLAGLAAAVFFPHDINEYENRYAEKLPAFSVNDYIEGKFQNKTELALADQIPFSEAGKKTYNMAFSKLRADAIAKLFPQQEVKPGEEGSEGPAEEKETYQYVALYEGLSIIGNHIVYMPYDFESRVPHFDNRASAINDLIEQYPDQEFFVYYIEKETDIDFSTAEKIGAYEYVREHINIEDDHIGCFEVSDFRTLDNYFYNTDHHWNWKGSYEGYKDVLSMLLPNDAPLQPVKEVPIAKFSGSKASGVAAQQYNEIFTAYKFDFPELSFTIDGQPAEKYGNQDYFIEMGETETKFKEILNYGTFYGPDSGELIIKNENNDNGNILIIGESYDNAILRLLGAHFSEIYSIDLRNYEALVGKEFHLKQYIEEHNIERVLLIGNIDYFISDIFSPEN